MTKPKVEHRVVCAYYGENFHQLHKWPKVTAKSAIQSVIDLNHQAEMQPNFYATCAPYRVQTREVVKWTDTTE